MVATNETDPISNYPKNGNNLKESPLEDINTINAFKSSKTDIVAHYTKTDSKDKNNEDNKSICSEESPIERVKFKGINDNDSICSDDSQDEKEPPIPDGGWGWVVVIAAFLVSACADGLAFSFGLLHEEFTNYFETSQSATSLIGSLFIATPLLAGPIMSALVDRFGCRLMTIIGGILSTVGFLLASVSNSVGMLCLTFGFLTGLAMGLLYVTAVVSVAFWFDKRRNLAVSLASCGIGFGTLVYSPLTKYLLYIFDWRNTVVILAGTVLNMCVCGAVMRDPEWLVIKQTRERKLSKARSRKSSSAGSVSSRSIGGDSVFLSPEELQYLLNSGKSPDYILAALVTTIAEAEQLEATTQMNVDLSSKRAHSAIHLPTFIQHNEKVPPEVIEKLTENKRIYNIILHNYPDLITRRKSEININVDNTPKDVAIEPAKLDVEVKMKTQKDKENKTFDALIIGQNLTDKVENKINEQNTHNAITVKELVKQKTVHKEVKPTQPTGWVRQLSIDHHYFKDVNLYRNTMMHRGAMMNIPRYRLRASSLPDMYKNSNWSLASSDEWTWRDRCLELIKTTFDIRMFSEFHFLMFNVASLILSIWFIVPYFFLNSFMNDSDVSGGEMMISIIGVASSIGIVVLGWAGDQPWINVTKTYAACLTICGLSVFAYPFFITNFWALGINSAIFGLSFASSYSYTPAILMELMPIDHFTVAYGLILSSQGIGHLAGPPLGGLIKDVTGTWDLTFYIGGGSLVVAGICVAVIAYTRNVRICGSAPLLKDLEKGANKV